MAGIRVFAYGSNLFVARLQMRTPSAELVSIARLSRYRLEFHKSGRDGSGKADVVETGNDVDVVWGAVYALDARDKLRLDELEGLGKHYLERRVDVMTPADELLSASTYHAHPQMIDASKRPYAWYKELVVEGCRYHRFPSEYVGAVASVESIDDPCAARVARERRVLEGEKLPS